MSHPSSCHDLNCKLSYRQHLLSINLSGAALPSRRVNRTKGHRDEPVADTLTREKRWDRDNAAYRRLHDEGLRPPHVDGAAHRERHGETRYDIEHRPVKIDYSDAR